MLAEMRELISLKLVINHDRKKDILRIGVYANEAYDDQ